MDRPFVQTLIKDFGFAPFDMAIMQPTLLPLSNCVQDVKHHPEGEVDKHTLIVLARMFEIIERDNLHGETELLMWTALMHDIGKPDTTVVQEDGKITAKGHAERGEEIVLEVMPTVGHRAVFTARVGRLVRFHMHRCFTLSDKTVRKMIKELDGDMRLLLALMEADTTGRDNTSKSFQTFQDFKAQVIRVASTPEPEERVTVQHEITGDTLLAWDVKPGKEFGFKLTKARVMFDSGETLDAIKIAVTQ